MRRVAAAILFAVMSLAIAVPSGALDTSAQAESDDGDYVCVRSKLLFGNDEYCVWNS